MKEMRGPHGGLLAFAAVLGDERGYGIGAAEENEPGYTPMPKFGRFDTFDEAQTEAMKHNVDRLGLTREQAYRIIGSSMAGEGTRRR